MGGVNIRLARIVASVPAGQSAHDVPATFIVGFSRCGKSTIARRLNRLFFHVNLDPVWAEIAALGEAVDARSVAMDFHELVLARRRTGLIVEGDNFVGENTAKQAAVSQPEAFLDAVAHFTGRGARFVFVGNAAADPDEKAAAISRYRAGHTCWTRGYSDRQTRDLAVASIGYSRDLKRVVSTRGLAYFDIGVATFDADIDRVLDHVLSPPAARPGRSRLAGRWLRRRS